MNDFSGFVLLTLTASLVISCEKKSKKKEIPQVESVITDSLLRNLMFVLAWAHHALSAV